MTLKIVPCAIGLALLVACADRDRLRDPGSVCIGDVPNFVDDDPQVGLTGSGATTLTILAGECVSGSTDWLRQECTVTQTDDGVLQVQFRVVRVSPLSQTMDCNFVTFDCGEVELDEGTWTLEYGDSDQTFTVPYSGPSICVGP